MTKTKQHKSQHYVPQGYLSAWCDADTPLHMEPYVWVFPRCDRAGKPKAPQNLFEETDFYTITRQGKRDLVLEHGLAELEGRFSELRQNKLTQELQVSVEEGAYLVAFIAAMSFRTKAQRDHQRAQWGEVKRKMDWLRDVAANATPEERSELARTSIGHNPHARRISPELVDELATNPLQNILGQQIATYIPILGQMEILVLRTDDPIGFITSDHPCVWMDPDAYRRAPFYRQANVRSPDFELSMPISPRQMLVLNWQISAYANVSSELVNEYNRRTRYYAYENFVVCRNETRAIWFDHGVAPEDSWEKRGERPDIDE